MGYPDFYHGKRIYQTFKSLNHGSTTPGYGSYDIFNYTGAGEVVFSQLLIENATLGVSLSDSIVCHLDGVSVHAANLFELKNGIQIEGSGIFYCRRYIPAQGLEINISKGIMFNKSFLIEFQQAAAGTVGLFGDLTLGVY